MYQQQQVNSGVAKGQYGAYGQITWGNIKLRVTRRKAGDFWVVFQDDRGKKNYVPFNYEVINHIAKIACEMDRQDNYPQQPSQMDQPQGVPQKTLGDMMPPQGQGQYQQQPQAPQYQPQTRAQGPPAQQPPMTPESIAQIVESVLRQHRVIQ